MDHAVIVSKQVPGVMQTGSNAELRLKILNAGDQVWSRPNGIRLGAVEDFDPFYKRDTRVDFPDGVTVAPGDAFDFVIPLQAPKTRGAYQTNWQMIREGIAWFGEISDTTIDVIGDHVVDPATLEKKLVMGYQGWFGYPGDESGWNQWQHWTSGATPGPSTIRTDLWPDVSEFEADELRDTDFLLPDGSRAKLFSSYNRKTIRRHFRWMREYAIDGCSIGRFTVGVRDNAVLRKTVPQLRHIRASAEEFGRVFFIAYDLTGHNPDSAAGDLSSDWRFLVEHERILDSPAYLRHNGRPVVFVWGPATNNFRGTAAHCVPILDFLQNGPPHLRATVMGGGPQRYRDLPMCGLPPDWAHVLNRYDLISPWMVNNFANVSDAANWYRDVFAGDVADCRQRGAGYVATAFPGFSWRNLEARNGRNPPPPLNEVRRLAGDFFWQQVFHAVDIRSTAILCAMFDECDEGTAMFKLAPTRAQLPTTGDFMALDVDGTRLPGDWYLRLAGEAGRMLRGEIQPTGQIPITP